jgi:hypothetical protein
VEAILGEPVQDEVLPVGLEDVHVEEERVPILLDWKLRDWRSEPHTISVTFDGRGRVVAKYYKRNSEAGWATRALDWLGW